jgi:hypothetical protein
VGKGASQDQEMLREPDHVCIETYDGSAVLSGTPIFTDPRSEGSSPCSKTCPVVQLLLVSGPAMSMQ